MKNHTTISHIYEGVKLIIGIIANNHPFEDHNIHLQLVESYYILN